eukprot:5332525-Pyramimonas_sp.AAC.1
MLITFAAQKATTTGKELTAVHMAVLSPLPHGHDHVQPVHVTIRATWPRSVATDALRCVRPCSHSCHLAPIFV